MGAGAVYSFLMLVGASAGMWAAIALLLAVFPKDRRLRLKHAGIAAVVFFGSVFAGAAIGPDKAGQKNDASPSIAASPGANTPAGPESRLTTTGEKADYIAKLQEAIADMERGPTIPDSPKSIGLMAILPTVWVHAYENGAALPLTKEDEAVRQRFKAAIIKWQAANLPKLRDAFGPAMSKELWIEDGEARTTGSGFRTVAFTHRRYAANRNIADDHKKVADALIRLRFTRAEYKWFKKAPEYTYFELTPPKDADLVIWTDGGFRIVK